MKLTLELLEQRGEIMYTNYPSNDSMLSIDLVEAAQKVVSFKEWHPERIAGVIERYKKFLNLSVKYKDVRLVPTQDIDIIWHLHMLRPRAYLEDCLRIGGHIIDHDNTCGTEPEAVEQLRVAFDHTEYLWQKEFGEPYTEPSTQALRAISNCFLKDHPCVRKP